MTTLALALALLTLSQGAPPTVALKDLTTRPDLVGKTVVVDGRVQRFDFQRDRGWNQLRFVDSPVLFRIPPALTSSTPPPERVARAQGVLRQEGGRYVVDVTSLQLYRSDLDRIDRAIAAAGPEDDTTREAWARWAESRAATYQDELLQARARSLAGEAIRIQADRPDARGHPDRQLELAREARRRGVPEVVPAALVHRALRQLLPEVRTANEAERLADLAAELLPEAAKSPQSADLAPWQAAYADDPAATYRRVGSETRAALDRQLLADALRIALERRAAEDPARALALADRAERELPDRPGVSRDLRRRGLESTDVSTLRLTEIRDRARSYEALGQPDLARALLRRWLDDQRAHRLSATDAEGRLTLAEQYETLVDDHETAAALLREAWTIDPTAPATADAFRRRGFRLVDGTWVAPGRAEASSSGPEAAPTADLGRDPYRGLTRQEVANLVGRPTRVSRTAVQGQIVEQWFIESKGGLRGDLYINFVQRPDFPAPVATSSYRQNP